MSARNDHRPTAAAREAERGSALVVALLLTVLLFALGAAMLTVSEAETIIASNDQNSEGAFLAAEAAVQVALDQLGPGVDVSALTVQPTDLGDAFSYRSGERADDTAQPPELVTVVPGPGFALGSGTGYATSGFVFEVYEVNGTGTGPRNAVREVEVQVELGPVAS